MEYKYIIHQIARHGSLQRPPPQKKKQALAANNRQDSKDAKKHNSRGFSGVHLLGSLKVYVSACQTSQPDLEDPNPLRDACLASQNLLRFLNNSPPNTPPVLICIGFSIGDVYWRLRFFGARLRVIARAADT